MSRSVQPFVPHPVEYFRCPDKNCLNDYFTYLATRQEGQYSFFRKNGKVLYFNCYKECALFSIPNDQDFLEIVDGIPTNDIIVTVRITVGVSVKKRIDDDKKKNALDHIKD